MGGRAAWRRTRPRALLLSAYVLSCTTGGLRRTQPAQTCRELGRHAGGEAQLLWRRTHRLQSESCPEEAEAGGECSKWRTPGKHGQHGPQQGSKRACKGSHASVCPPLRAYPVWSASGPPLKDPLSLCCLALALCSA